MNKWWIILGLIIPMQSWADVDINYLKQLFEPSNYKTGQAYWGVLERAKLVNTLDKQAKETVWMQDDFASRVKVEYTIVNLFASSIEEVVIQLTFNEQSCYVHFFYQAEGNWVKAAGSLDYIDADRVVTQRTIKLSFKELYHSGESILIVEKTNHNHKMEHTTTWMAFWKIEYTGMLLLHTQKTQVVSTNENYTATLDWSEDHPALLKIKSNAIKTQHKTTVGVE